MCTKYLNYAYFLHFPQREIEFNSFKHTFAILNVMRKIWSIIVSKQYKVVKVIFIVSNEQLLEIGRNRNNGIPLCIFNVYWILWWRRPVLFTICHQTRNKIRCSNWDLKVVSIILFFFSILYNRSWHVFKIASSIYPLNTLIKTIHFLG